MKNYEKELQIASEEYDEYLRENFVEMLLQGKILDEAPKFVEKPVLRLFSDTVALNKMVNKATAYINRLESLKPRTMRVSTRASTIIEKN